PRPAPACPAAVFSSALSSAPGSRTLPLPGSQLASRYHHRRLTLHSALARMLVSLQRFLLRFPVHLVTLHQHSKIHLVRVKLRPIHACKLALPAHQHPAPSAHPRSINHDRVQAHNRLYPMLARKVRHRFHHRHRPHGQHQLNFLARADQFPQLVRHQPLFPVTPVIRRHVQRVAHFPHLFFQQHQLPAPSSQYRQDPVARALQRRRRRICQRRSHSASQHRHRPVFFNLRRLSQRPYHVQYRLALFHRIQFTRRLPHSLHNNPDRSFFPVRTLNRYRDAFASFMQPQNHKLSRLVFLRDPRDIDHKSLDPRRNEFRIQDSVHAHPFLFRVLTAISHFHRTATCSSTTPAGGNISVPSDPPNASSMLSGAVISARFPPASRYASAASTFGPMLPAGNSPCVKYSSAFSQLT